MWGNKLNKYLISDPSVIVEGSFWVSQMMKRQKISPKWPKNVIDYIFKFTSFLGLFTI